MTDSAGSVVYVLAIGDDDYDGAVVQGVYHSLARAKVAAGFADKWVAVDLGLGVFTVRRPLISGSFYEITEWTVRP